MLKTHCFFHKADLDGHCSGALVKLAFPETILHPYNYNDPFPWNEIGSSDIVWFVDISLPIEDMLRLKDTCRLIWIDHHVTIINKALAVNFNPEGARKVGEAACELTWDFLFPEKEMPDYVRMLGRFDVWEHKDDPDILALQHGMKSYETLPSNSMGVWKMLHDYPMFAGEIISRGKIVKDFNDQDWKLRAHSLTHLVEFEGYRFLAANVSGVPSQFFDSLKDAEDYDAFMTFSFQHGSWKISMYSSKIDVSPIALKYGGGGHKGAAGFSLPHPPPFKILKEYLDN